MAREKPTGVYHKIPTNKIPTVIIPTDWPALILTIFWPALRVILPRRTGQMIVGKEALLASMEKINGKHTDETL